MKLENSHYTGSDNWGHGSYFLLDLWIYYSLASNGKLNCNWIFISFLVFILLVLAIYFYLKMLLIRRDLAKCKEELRKIARKSDNSGHGELE